MQFLLFRDALCGLLPTTSLSKAPLLETKLKKGIVFKADTVEEMAKKMNVDPKVLQQTLDRYNEFAAKKEDPTSVRQHLLS